MVHTLSSSEFFGNSYRDERRDGNTLGRLVQASEDDFLEQARRSEIMKPTTPQR